LSPDHQRWIHPRYPFFLPVQALSRVFGGKFVAGLKHAFHKRELVFPGLLKPLAEEQAFRAFLRLLFCQDWVVYAKPPFGGPRHVLQYLARYTHRVAISNHRLVSFADNKVTFRWKDYAHGNKRRLMTLTAEEFLRRFLLHVLPRGFVRIRFFGFMANRRRTELLPRCQQLLSTTPEQSVPTSSAGDSQRSTGWRCPMCSGEMVMIERLTAQQLRLQLLGQENWMDSS
jgi:Putative transposase